MAIFENIFNVILLAIFGGAAYSVVRGRKERRSLRVKQEQVAARVNNDTAIKVQAISTLCSGIDAVLLHIAKEDLFTNEASIVAAANRVVDSFYFSWLSEYGHHFYLPMTRVRITGVHERIALYELPEPLSAFLEKHVK